MSVSRSDTTHAEVARQRGWRIASDFDGYDKTVTSSEGWVLLEADSGERRVFQLTDADGSVPKGSRFVPLMTRKEIAHGYADGLLDAISRAESWLAAKEGR